MNSQIINNRYINKNLFMIFLIAINLITSCSRKQSYEEIVKKELAQGVHYDSIIYGVRLGMTYYDFYSYCWEKNQEGIFKPNISGTGVMVILEEGFNSPVVLEFFPQVNHNSENIMKYNATIKYKNFSYYNKKHSIENLLNETLQAFEKGYKGNTFFTIPHKNKLLKYNYIKIDGNRKIIIEPTFEGDQLIIKFEDLNG